MLNIAWVCLLVIGMFFGIYNCRADEVATALVDSASDAVMFALEIAGVVSLWCGMMNILKKAGFIDRLAKLISPVICIFFPEAKYDNDVRENLVSNIAANFFGLGNAATPYGIKTVKKLQSYAPDKYTASKSVRFFLVTNSAAIQLLPATVIAMRAAAGSVSPASIVFPVWIISLAAFITSLLAFYVLEIYYGFKRRLFK